LERRVLAGLKNRMMAPEASARGDALLREGNQPAGTQAQLKCHVRWAELASIDKQITQIVDAIADGMYPSLEEGQDDRAGSPEGGEWACWPAFLWIPTCRQALRPSMRRK
jgi:hypothetical protein